MNHLTSLNPEQLSNWLIEARQKAQNGQLPDYIPLLSQADPHWLAIEIFSIEGQSHARGDIYKTFPLMSVIKPFILLYVLANLGKETVFNCVGKEPSEYPFNSLFQLQIDEGFPRNPMINSGAITLASLLPGENGQSRCENLRLWLNQSAHCHLFLDELTLTSVLSRPNLNNQALAQELGTKGYLKDPEIALDTYNHICCLAGTVTDLARLGLLLVSSPSALKEHASIVREIMKTCGLYEASAAFAIEVGYPTKSGVSGAVLSLVPKQGAIACYSPPLDPQGNSVAGLFLVRKIKANLSI